VALPAARAAETLMSRRTAAEFLDEFVLPLVRGGELVVGPPLSAQDLQDFTDELPHASEALVAVDEARADVLSELVVRVPALILDADELHLAAAVHNLLFLAHPRVDSITVTSAARRKVLETAQRFAAQPLSTSRRRVLARHGLLHNVFDISRADVTLSWWTGSATYRGQRPPGRLLAWRGVRRVREETSVASYDELLSTAEASPVMASLLRRSPLTQLCATHPGSPPLHWEDAVFLLRDAELARAVSYAALRPAEPKALVAVPARFAAAFEQMLERNPAEPDVRAVAAFLVHLNALLAMGETRDRDLDARSALLTTVLAPERAGQRPRGLATFFALPNALSIVDDRLAAPPGLDADPALSRRWRRDRAQVAEAVGEAVVETLAARLSRHLRALQAAETAG
jgi:hypothetical protein